MWAAYRGLVSDRPFQRGHAIEFLDNTVEGELKKILLMVIDDSPLAERLSQAERSMGIQRRSRMDVLRTALQGDSQENPDAYGLPMAALYWVYTEAVFELNHEVARLCQSASDPRVRETAAWVARRLKLTDM
jgi:hypothetical protein